MLGWLWRLLFGWVPADFFDVEPEMMRLADLLAAYRDGEEHGWETEFAWLHEHDGDRLAALRADIRINGIREPVLLGNDGRVWDGHHRLCVAADLRVAADLQLAEVPVTREW